MVDEFTTGFWRGVQQAKFKVIKGRIEQPSNEIPRLWFLFRNLYVYSSL